MILDIVLAAVLVFLVGTPIVIAFDKARKEMEGDGDVQNR
jgi:hypothetical protein